MKMFSRIVISLVFIGVIALYNYLLVDIRFEELYSLLGSAASREEALTTFSILAKYESVKSVAEDDYDPCLADHGPEIKAILSEVPAEDISGKNDYRAPVRYIVRGIRLLLGKKVIRPKEDDQIITVLKIGYFFERNGRYRPAMKVYNDVLQTGGVDPAIRAAVMMHKAFCISMLGNFRDSKLIYEQVINQYSSSGTGALSWKLIDCIQDMERKRQSIEEQDTTALEKARKFINVMDFQAAGMYAALAESRIQPGTAQEVHYYKGRSFEGLGMDSEAGREYRSVNRIDRMSSWARKADCRLKAIGQFDADEKHIAVEAQRRLAVYRDRMFSEKVKSYAQDVSQNMLRNELLNDGGQTGQAPAQDSIKSAVMNIAATDLTGGTSAAAQQRKLDSIRNVLVQKGDTGGAGMKDSNRHPYRRPTAIKTVIDSHKKELAAVYKKRLKSKIKLTGRMLVGLTIRANGAVSRVSIVQSDIGDQTFEKEVLRCIWAWKFRAVPARTGDLTIQYPFEFP